MNPLTVTAVVFGALVIWAGLIAAWWSYWHWYGNGQLHPTSWRAIVTMPIWSVRSIWAAKKKAKQVKNIAAALEAHPQGSFDALRASLQVTREHPPEEPTKRRALADSLEDGLRTAPPNVPADIRATMKQLIEELRNV